MASSIATMSIESTRGMHDNNGVATDFVGLRYASPNRFDTINIELGFQFGDGGDWQSMPRVFILKNPTLVGDTVPPEMSPNWVEVLGATETAGHVFSPLVTPGPADDQRHDPTQSFGHSGRRSHWLGLGRRRRRRQPERLRTFSTSFR